MADDDEEERICICMPANQWQPTVPSTQVDCADCGFAVWISDAMKANVYDAFPNTKARCITCARKFAMKHADEMRIEPTPDWQRAEIPDLDFDEANRIATDWLNGKW